MAEISTGKTSKVKKTPKTTTAQPQDKHGVYPVKGKKQPGQVVNASAELCGIDKLPEKTQAKFKEILAQSGSTRKVEDFNSEEAEAIVKANGKESYDKRTAFIKEHFNLAMDVAKKLHEMQDTKLFLLKYESFQGYVEAEFDFTPMRANQLVNAEKIALLINGEVEKNTIVNESQARELRKLRRYFPSGIINQKATKQARVDLIWELKKEHQDETISAKMIRARVSQQMAGTPKLRQGKVTMPKYEAALKKSMTANLTKFNTLYDKLATDTEKAQAKEAYLKELNALIAKISAR